MGKMSDAACNERWERQKTHKQLDDCFFAIYQIDRKTIFSVSYYFFGDNAEPYFATSCSKFNQPKNNFIRAGQAQESLLPPNSPAMFFYAKWQKRQLEKLPADELNRLIADVFLLKNYYNSKLKWQKNNGEDGVNLLTAYSFAAEKELSMEKIKKFAFFMEAKI